MRSRPSGPVAGHRSALKEAAAQLRPDSACLLRVLKVAGARVLDRVSTRNGRAGAPLARLLDARSAARVRRLPEPGGVTP